MRPTHPPRPESPEAAVAQFAADLRRRVLGERFRHTKALVAQADAIGIGRSTIYSALGGQRPPSEYTLRRLLATAAGADDDEIERWVAARAELDGALPDPVVADASRSADPLEARRQDRRGRAVWTLGGAICGALLVIGAQGLLSAPEGPSHPDATTGNLCNPVPDDRARSVTAMIVGTQGEGVYTHLSPGGECRAGFLPERSEVDVVCVVLDGPDVVTTQNGGQRRWPVWDRLASGAYVSDLYTDLPKPPAPALVEDLPRC